MALDHYGVLIGQLTGHQRDKPDEQGRWFHVMLDVTAAGAQYRCAIDVDSKQSLTGVQWRVLQLAPEQIPPVPGLADGYHELPRTPSSGALDLIRHPALRPFPGCWFVVAPPAWLQDIIDGLTRAGQWTTGSHLEASTALETILVVGRRALVWGEPFNTGLGMHNVHQNQGDPAGSQWWAENASWQDGAVMTERADGSLDVFISKFSTQASRTDNYGHPL
jgi:uncharacterized protein YukJ